MRKAILAGLLFFPGITLAAGFASQSLFLSKSTVTEGEIVRVYAVVENDTATSFSGTLVLSDEDGQIGTVPVSLTAGEADTLSVSWKPSAGRHTVTANLENATGASVTSESASFTISQKPEPAAASPATPARVDSSAGIQDAIANISPGAAQTLAPALNIIDSGRAKAASALDSGISYTKSQAVPGQVLGAETVKNTQPTPSGIGHTLWQVSMTLALYVLSILRYIVGNAGVFYPVLAVVFLFFLWRMFRRYRRPSY